MPTAWDGLNLPHNLNVFKDLRTAKSGTTLSFSESSGRSSPQEPGVLQTVARTLSLSDSVESESHFGVPVKRLFEAARGAIVRGVITQGDFDDALAGLRRAREASRCRRA